MPNHRGRSSEQSGSRPLCFYGAMTPTRWIRLADGAYAAVDAADYAQLVGRRWYRLRKEHTDYCGTWIGGRTVSMHRLLLSPAKGEHVDHINHCGLDNRRDNLRACSPADNHRNARPYRQRTRAAAARHSRFKGVHWYASKNKWGCGIRADGRYRHLGMFTDESDAARAYDVAARELHGEFAYLNFPTAA